ncbi:MAG: hypothetical protein CMO30_24620 [Tistrella sp.]|uniref:Uncharacterized protein n=1 Tax=Tistrella mobilis TaxID=171437 RepID=A0A3B9IF39_9PROT|nr:hypothetical protein [Tistrella sp.]MAD35463.1 hypothetical protein [Tistrella sp.]MBA78464.1 hypothetical protein [Tistrella sp.]HAE45839.1 hypothetical protein [Tistrella mobilis]
MTIRTLLARTSFILSTLAAMAVLLLLLSALVANVVYAADTTASAATAAVGPVIESVLGAIGVIAGGYAVRLINRAVVWLGLEQDARVRAYLEDATLSAIDYATQLLGAAITTPEGKTQAVEVAVNYLRRRVPDALSRFDLAGADGAADLWDYVTARLPGRSTNG